MLMFGTTRSLARILMAMTAYINNGDGTGYVQRGDCTSDTDSGVFINGTIDVNSFKYNATNNSSSFSYTTESGGLGTGLLQGPDLSGIFFNL